MKKLIKNLIFMLFLAFCQSAFCYTLSPQDLHKIIFDKINSETKQQLGDVEYELNIQSTVSGNIITNDLTIPKIEISPSSNFNPISYRRVTIKDLKGNIVKTLFVNVRISIFQDVLVATEQIPFGNAINASNSKLEKREISKLLEKVILEPDNNMISSRNIMKNSIIQKNSIKQKAIVEKNQSIDIIFLGKGIQITLRGKALKEGAIGDTIPVRSDKYNKIYSATIDSSSKVTVRI